MRLPRRQTQPLTRSWSSSGTSAVAALIALNVASFLAQKTTELFAAGWIEHWVALSAGGMRAMHGWQLLSYALLHSGPLHLLLNMLALYFAGREVETIAGPRHLLAVYWAGALAGGLAAWSFAPDAALIMGSSAGVCAVLIAFTTILPEIELTTLLFYLVPLRMRAKLLAIGIVGLSLAFLAAGICREFAQLSLAGALVGWLYAHQLGYGNPWRIQRYIFERRQRAQRLERMPPRQFIAEEIDPILEKIARSGIQSLTRAERRILDQGRQKIAAKPARP